MPPIHPDKIADILRDVAETIIEPRFANLNKNEIHTKSGPTDLVTIADIESEEKLTKVFKDLLPGSYVVGEEAVSREEVPMSALRTETGPVWVIDPVDGTGNFARGHPVYGIIIALAKGGETVMSWIYDIPGKRMAMAEQGGGVEINGGQRLIKPATSPLKDMRGFVSRKFLPKKMQREMEPVLDEHFGNVETYLCCAHEYLDILEGEGRFSLYSRIRPWDHLAGAMMVTEAGGYNARWDGSPYGPGAESGGLINTPDKATWDEIHQRLLKPYVD
jgi:fructose-1,6-bisphosphatase/inositol monophosphatase family enzyme